MAGPLDGLGADAVGACPARQPHRVAHLVHESVRAAGPVSEHHEAERVGSHVNHGQAPLGAVAGERYAR